MPATLTLKNIPDFVYQQLKAAAVLHRRSMNSEAIVCLEQALLPTKLPVNEHLARARALRSTLPSGAFHSGDMDIFKTEGRS